MLVLTAPAFKSELYCEYSDTYKMLHGIRPRWVDPRDCSIGDLRAMCADLWNQVDEMNFADWERDMADWEAEQEAAFAEWTHAQAELADERRWAEIDAIYARLGA